VEVSTRNRGVRLVVRSGNWRQLGAALGPAVWLPAGSRAGGTSCGGYLPGRQVSTRNSSVRLVVGWSGSRERPLNLVLNFCCSLLSCAAFLAFMSYGFRLIPCCFLGELVKNGEEGRLRCCYVCENSAISVGRSIGNPQKGPFNFSERLSSGLRLGMLRHCLAFGFKVVSVGKLEGVCPGIAGGDGQLAESQLVSVAGRQPFNRMFMAVRPEPGGGR